MYNEGVDKEEASRCEEKEVEAAGSVSETKTVAGTAGEAADVVGASMDGQDKEQEPVFVGSTLYSCTLIWRLMRLPRM